MVYSSSNLDYKSYKIYTGGTIDGEETNGLYTNINSYTGGEEITFNDSSVNVNRLEKNNISDTLLKALLIEISALIVVIIFAIMTKNKKLVD